MSRESEQALREATEHLRAARVARFRGTLMNRRHSEEDVRRAMLAREEAGQKFLAAVEGLLLSIPCTECHAEIDEPCLYDNRTSSVYGSNRRSARNPHPSRRKASGIEEITTEVEAALKEAARD